MAGNVQIPKVKINVKILFSVKIRAYGAHFEDWRTALL